MDEMVRSTEKDPEPGCSMPVVEQDDDDEEDDMFERMEVVVTTGSEAASKDETEGSGGEEDDQNFRAEMMKEVQRRLAAEEEDFIWDKFLEDYEHVKWLAPVQWFKNAPFSSNWETIARADIYVEVPHPHEDKLASSEGELIYALGQILAYAGYYALVKFIQTPGETNEPSFTWIPFLSLRCKHVGYCFDNDLLLHPLTSTRLSDEDLGQANVELFDTIRFHEGQTMDTLMTNFTKTVDTEFKRCASRYVVNEYVEVVDKQDSSRYVIGVVLICAGDRIFVKYFNASKDAEDDGFWYFQTSPMVHKLGWCQEVGALLLGGNDVNLVFSPRLEDRQDFPLYPKSTKIVKDMVFEIRHPILPHKIVPGYCVRILNHGYIVAGTDWTCPRELIEVVMHISSDYILKPGFCKEHGITLRHGIKTKDFWDNVRKEGKSAMFVPPKKDERRPNPFKVGAKLETTEVAGPFKIVPATVVQTAGHLVKLLYDGKNPVDPKSYQWVSYDSGVMYPAGYAEIMDLATKGKPDPPKKFYVDKNKKPSQGGQKRKLN